LIFTAFDIETGPIPEDQLLEVVPAFDRSTVAHPGVFDPKSVKIGNLKNKELIDEKIEAARKVHRYMVAGYEQAVADAEKAYWSEICANAALSSTTGRILAIGYCNDDGYEVEAVGGEVSEFTLLTEFWKMFERHRRNDHHMVGFNIFGFDLPFICQRSVMANIPVPRTAFNGRYPSPVFIDLRETWKFGSTERKGSLETICRALGIGGKTEGVTGDMFAKLWLSDKQAERDLAIEYLERDIEMTYELGSRLL
jgi:uncharacterized protein YprB with RNaseH-like and TPR domain